jgi:putative transposase
MIPVDVACLDLALTRLPRTETHFALDIDEPLYFSVHSTVADLAPAGAATVHVAKYLDLGATGRADLDELEGVPPKNSPVGRNLRCANGSAIGPVMVRWLAILSGTLKSTVRTHSELALENLALRQQLALWKARQPRPRLTVMDRIFWVLLSRLWTGWRYSLQVVRPETVVGWHRQGFRRYWAWKSRRRRGRPMIGTELRELIWRISRANPLWGAPRIHGELLKLGLTVSQAGGFQVHAPASEATVAGVARVSEEPRQGSDRRRFLHSADRAVSSAICARDADTQPAPAGAFQRDGASDRGMDGATTAGGMRAGGGAPVSDPGPRPGLWRAIFASGHDVGHPGSGDCGSIRRECLDHVVVIGERHLRRILSKYVDYYNRTRTHLSLSKDAPEHREVQRPSHGRVVEVPRVGGLHHEYLRRAA